MSNSMITIRLTPQLKRSIQLAAKIQHRSVTGFVNLAIESAVAKTLNPRTHSGSCDAPNCDHEGEVLSCYDCGGEFCWEHSEQEHHNCMGLSNGCY